MVTQITSYKQQQQRFIGEFAHPIFVTLNTYSAPKAQVLVETKTSGAKVLDSQGRVVTTLPPDNGSVIVGLSFQDASWMVEGIQSLK